MQLVTSSSLALKWNGEKLDNFEPRRGLRQGDPISPYLFGLCMEKLALLILQLVHEKKWHPIKISKDGPAISHLFFVDDCLLFTQAKSSQVKLVQEVLQKFCLASGLKVSVQKTRFLVSKNVTIAKISKFASITSFQHTSNLGKYIGFPLLTGRVKKNDFGYILEKVNSRLACWKQNLLSRAGRVTLTKSVLAAVPVYSMQNFWLPSGVCDSLDSCIRRFIWGGNHYHWVKWDSVTLPRNEGGLGFHPARESNISLLGKWDMLHSQDKIWVQILSAKYLKGAHILDANYAVGASYIWNSILKTASHIKSGFKYRIGKCDIYICMV